MYLLAVIEFLYKCDSVKGDYEWLCTKVSQTRHFKGHRHLIQALSP